MAAAKVSEQAAGYMELRGAVKDGGCALVQIEGGVSKKLGCCNLFEPDSDGVSDFRCGTCEYVRGKQT